MQIEMIQNLTLRLVAFKVLLQTFYCQIFYSNGNEVSLQFSIFFRMGTSFLDEQVRSSTSITGKFFSYLFTFFLGFYIKKF